MPLDKIRFANKKAKREQKRRQKRIADRMIKSNAKIRNGRARKMMVQGRREHLAQRRSEIALVNQMEQDLDS